MLFYCPTATRTAYLISFLLRTFSWFNASLSDKLVHLLGCPGSGVSQPSKMTSDKLDKIETIQEPMKGNQFYSRPTEVRGGCIETNNNDSSLFVVTLSSTNARKLLLIRVMELESDLLNECENMVGLLHGTEL